MTNQQRRNMLIGDIKEGTTSLQVLGFIVFWNIRNCDLTQEQFAAKLTANNLSDTWAREHNYRSAFTRALRNMEEKRVIKRVREDENELVFQFTAENLIRSQDTLEYEKETTLILNKNKYKEDQDFAAALTQGKSEIKDKVVAHFHTEKTKYNSSDMTRYIQNILTQNADIVSLREQGCVYFVPIGYREVMDNVIGLVRSIGTSTMDFIPIPNVEASRNLIENALVDEVDATIARLEKEVEAVERGEKSVTEKWSENKLAKIKAAVNRMEQYATVLHDDKLAKLNNSFKALEGRISLGNRKLSLV
jgi:hypothetical protein